MTLPRLRQIVLITADLEPAVAEARSTFALPKGVRDADGMAEIGFEHEVLTFDQTFLEIVAPLDADGPQGQMVQAQGEHGFMTVLQVDDLAAVVDRAGELGFAPVLHQEFHGNPISQWHPKHLGTLAEFDEMDRPDNWHFAPESFEVGSTEVAQDIVAAQIATDDPEAMAARWATVLGVSADGAQVPLASGTVQFIPTGEGRRGLRSADLVATDPQRVGESVTLCGVEFRFVAGA